MKKTVLVVALFIFASSLFAQEIVDGSFENNWTSVPSERGEYWDYENNLFRTLNSLYQLPTVPITTELTAFREGSNAQEGQYAIRLESASFAGIVFVPGAFGTIGENVGAEYVATGGITIKTDFAHQPLFLKGYYKYAPVAGDSASIELELSYHDEIIAHSLYIEKNAVNEWKAFSIPVTYSVPQAPTHLKLIFSSSAAYDFANLMNCAGQVGSALYIDNLSFQYDPEGLEEPLLGKQSVSVYPNPSSEMVHFDLGKKCNGQLVIYNMLGAEITRLDITNQIMEYNVSSLDAGNYFYRVIDGKTITSSGKFVVNGAK